MPSVPAQPPTVEAFARIIGVDLLHLLEARAEPISPVAMGDPSYLEREAAIRGHELLDPMLHLLRRLDHRWSLLTVMLPKLPSKTTSSLRPVSVWTISASCRVT